MSSCVEGSICCSIGCIAALPACFKGFQRCFSGVLLYATVEHQRIKRREEHALLVKMRDSLRSSRASTEDLAKSYVEDVGSNVFWIRFALQRAIPQIDVHVIDVIVRFARPVLPQLAFLGCSALHGLTQETRHLISQCGVRCSNSVHVVASEGGILACVTSGGDVAVSWNLHSQESSHHPTLYSGAPSPLLSLSINVALGILVGGCEDGEICVWSVGSGELLATCEYYEWYDRCGRYGLGHWFPVKAVSSGAVFDPIGRDIVSGDEKGTLCAWQLGFSGGLAKFCVNVVEHMGNSSSIITCTASKLGLVLCGLYQGLSLGYSAESGECLFLLATPMTSAVMALGFLHSTPRNVDKGEGERLIGCFNDGSLLRWNVSEYKGVAYPVQPDLRACEVSPEVHINSERALAHLRTEEGHFSAAWAANSDNENELILKWTTLDSVGRLSSWGTQIPWPIERGELHGLVQI